MKTAKALGRLFGKLIVVTLFYLMYKLVGFESAVVIILAGIFVNTNPERKTKVTVSGKDVSKIASRVLNPPVK